MMARVLMFLTRIHVRVQSIIMAAIAKDFVHLVYMVGTGLALVGLWKKSMDWFKLVPVSANGARNTSIPMKGANVLHAMLHTW